MMVKQLKGLLRKKIKKILLGFITYEDLQAGYNERKLRKSRSQISLGHEAVLYPDALIFNLQNDRQKISIGSNSHIRCELHVFSYGGLIEIGEWCYIGDQTRIWSGEKVRVGNNVFISHNVFISDTTAHEIEYEIRAKSFYDSITFASPQERSTIKTKPIVICDHAWVNPYSIILSGVTIGKGAIVASGSVVTRDVPDFAVVGGNPAKILKYIDNTNESQLV